MALSDITPFILSRNEEANLTRTLDALAWAPQILLVDSGSTDRTLEIAARYSRVRVVQRAFDSHAGQANHALGLVATRWVMSLDADYVLSSALQEALRAGEISLEAERVYLASFIYCIEGRPLRNSLLPARAILFPRAGARYIQDGHAHRLQSGILATALLPHPVFHDDRKSLEVWLASQDRYARLEVEKLRTAPAGSLSWPDRLRRTGWAAPLVVFPYLLFVRGLIWDGWPGLFYTFQRVYAEILLALYFFAARLKTDVPLSTRD